MIYLVFAIIIHSYLFVCFRLFKVYNVHTFTAIVINYACCVLAGLGLQAMQGKALISEPISEWWWIALLLGTVFISTFYIMALCSQKIGVSVSSVAAKTSMVAPIIYSTLVANTSSLSLRLILGISLAFLAIVFISLKKGVKTEGSDTAKLLLPAGIFLGSALLDLIINIVNHRWIYNGFKAEFSSTSFFFASCFGLLVLLILKQHEFTRKNIIAGILLGVPNFFSIYLLMLALSELNHDGALIFPLLNVGTILTSSLVSILFFKERLSLINYLGLASATGGVILLSF